MANVLSLRRKEPPRLLASLLSHHYRSDDNDGLRPVKLWYEMWIGNVSLLNKYLNTRCEGTFCLRDDVM